MKDDYRVEVEGTHVSYRGRSTSPYRPVIAGNPEILSWGTQGWAYFHQLAVF